MLLSKELIVPKKGKQIWPAETRPAVLVLVLRYGALNCAPLRSGPEQELNHSKPVIPASTQFMSFSKFYEFTERMLHQHTIHISIALMVGMLRHIAIARASMACRRLLVLSKSLRGAAEQP